MKQINPQDLIIHINTTPPSSKKGDVVALDLEIFHMDKNRLHRPHGDFAGIGCTYDGKEVWILTSEGLEDESTFPSYMWVLDNALHVYHNAKFDVGQIRRYCDYPDRKLLWDTMVMEQIMFAGWFGAGEFGLNDLSRRWLDVYMDKSVREQFENYENDTMSKEQIEYLAVDVVTTWRVQQAQSEHADENDLNVWYNIDRCAIYSLLKMNGMMLDVEAWKELARFNRSESERIQAKYGKIEPVEKVSRGKTVTVDKFVGINLGSWQQVSKELSNQGFEIDSTNEKSLNTITDKCEFARDVLDYRGFTKAAGTYGEKWVDEFVEPDGRIYSNFYVNGTATRRFSSSSPNVENIPSKDGNAFRKCFIAQPGYVLVDADFSTQEPRIWAYIAEDWDMIKLFKDKEDIYLYFALKGFGWVMPKSDPRRKLRMKPTVLGAIFGLTEYGLLNKDQIPLVEGKELLNVFWNKVFPLSKVYADKIRQTRDYVQSVYGGKYWINPYQNGHENNAMNSPVQMTAAEVIKIAGYKFQLLVEKAGYSEFVWLVNYVHDELVVECRKDLKDWVVQNLGDVMMKVAERTHDGVPAAIEVSSGLTWAEAHN